jgi:hypothetical protein
VKLARVNLLLVRLLALHVLVAHINLPLARLHAHSVLLANMGLPLGNPLNLLHVQALVPLAHIHSLGLHHAQRYRQIYALLVSLLKLEQLIILLLVLALTVQ